MKENNVLKYKFKFITNQCKNCFSNKKAGSYQNIGIHLCAKIKWFMVSRHLTLLQIISFWSSNVLPSTLACRIIFQGQAIYSWGSLSFTLLTAWFPLGNRSGKARGRMTTYDILGSHTHSHSHFKSPQLPFHGWENWGSERISNLLLAKGRTRIQIRSVFKPIFLPFFYWDVKS